ncbi:hypothetical protein L228DRAFT_286154 [Xylona heveae TC161]|uniref:Uncharacterized protein n=1 Tax=Xylona heveae (strain CBS 132557 / TC161) TaxID=1328760 RepID=A0A164ZC31_XYLHT|nr:hypothetical protein L228DRAFT_286154 [Xylona heveae TC161]KZF18918.1 hypothetical protein L228DRAFT_286154 [Xylona heveae TC161]
MSLQGDSSIVEVHVFLQQLAAISKLSIVPREICAKDSATLNHNQSLRDCAEAEEMAPSAAFETVAGAARLSRQKGTLYLLATPPNIIFEQTNLYQQYTSEWTDEEKESHRRDHQAGLGAWHCCAAFYHQRTVYLYDPTYPNLNTASPPPYQISQFRNLGMARLLVNKLRAKRQVVDHIYLGGGGNDTDVCRDMCGVWLQHVVDLVNRGTEVNCDSIYVLAEGYEKLAR